MKTGKQKRLATALFIVVLLLVSGAVVVPKLVDLNRYKGWLVSVIEEAVEGEVAIGHITWGISTGIWLRTDQFSITRAAAIPVDINLAQTYARVAVLPLLSKRIEIEELTLDGPGVVIKIKPGPEKPVIDEPDSDERVVLEDKTAQGISKEALGVLLPIGISVEKLSIQNGRIRIENEATLPGEKLVHAFKAVTIEASDIIPGREIEFRVSLANDGAAGSGSLQAKGTFSGLTQTFVIEDPKLKVTAVLSSFDTKILAPYLKGSSPDKKLGGLVSLELAYAGDLLGHHRVDGSVDLSDFRVHSPSLGEELFFEGKSKIGLRGMVDPNDIRIEALDIKIKNNRVNAKGLVKGWKEKPIVQDILVSASLFSGELVGLIPWKLMNRYMDNLVDNLRSALEAGGQLEIKKFSIGSIPLTRPFPDPMEFLSEMGLAARVSNLSIPPMPGILPGMPKIEQVSGSIGLAKGRVTLKDVQFKTSYSPASIEGLTARVDITRDRINLSEFSTAIVIPRGDEKTQGGRFSVKLAGHLDDWQKEPVARVQSFTTSAIPLNPVASIIPWDQIFQDPAGDRVDLLKEVLLAGGSLRINNCSLPGINLTNPNRDKKGVIQKIVSKTKAGLEFSGINIRPGPAYPLFDGISGNVTLDKGVLNLSSTRGRMGPVTLPSLQVQAEGFDDDLEVTARLKGPVKVMETDKKQVDTFLLERGFKRFTGGAQIDVDVKYFQKHPEKWVAKGSFVLEGVNAQSYPKGVHLRNALGKIFFSRAETTEIRVENLSGTINDAPVNLAGKLLGGRTEEMVIEGKVRIKDLDLAEFDSLLPYVENLTVMGSLDADLAFNIPFARPADTLVDGSVTAAGLGFFLPGYPRVTNTNIALECGGGRAELKNMDTTINDQVFHLSGHASDPAAPRVYLRLQSPDLDVDRLLAGEHQMAKQAESSKQAEPAKQSKPSVQADSQVPAVPDPLGQPEDDLPENQVNQGLPAWADNVTMDLEMDIDRGRYRNQPFTDLALLADYERGILGHYGLTLSLAGGKLVATGSADLRNPQRITFVMNPDISQVQIGELSPLFAVEKMPLEGPLSITGRLEGEAGDELLSSLEGRLEADVGQGRVPEVKHLGKIATQVFSFINIKGLFSGSLTDQMQKKGIPFRAVHSKSTFTQGNMNLENLIFISHSLNGNAQGVINFADEKIGLEVVLEPLQTFDKFLGLVPLLGKQAQKLTKVHLTVQGPLDNPKVETVMTKGVTEAIKGTLGIPGAVFKDTEELSGEIEAYMEEVLEDKNTK